MTNLNEELKGMHKIVAESYERMCERALESVRFMSPYTPPVLTPKQKIKREIRYRKRMLGKLIYKLSNKLGYYDDEYY